MEAVILIGIQAVGKSTFYCQHLADTHVRINLDMLQTRHRERILVNACLEAKQPFVVDNKNVTAAERAKYIVLAKAAHFRVIGYYFPSSLNNALSRNRQRPFPKAISQKGVSATCKRLQPPKLSEGFDKLYSVTFSGPDRFTIQELGP